MKNMLEVRDLYVYFQNNVHLNKALEQVSFTAEKGEIIGLVGESGCGKSLTSLSIMGLLPENAVCSGQIEIGGKEFLSLPEEEKCAIRGKEISMIFQEPMTALNPLVPVGRQIAETYAVHHSCTRAKANGEALLIMKKVGLSRAGSLFHEYPHQLSGGMKQRIIIAMALINSPGLLIADEPTTALDVTIQLQILELIKGLNKEFSSTVLLISHDLGVVKEICTRVLVMYGGFIVEEGGTAEILGGPLHPYTQKLLFSIPSASRKGQPLHSIPGIVAPLSKRREGCCPFCDRCSEAKEICFQAVPEIQTIGTRRVRCHLAGGEMIG